MDCYSGIFEEGRRHDGFRFRSFPHLPLHAPLTIYLLFFIIHSSIQHQFL